MSISKFKIKRRKVVFIGAGHVGSHAGYALASQGLVEEIVYIDIDNAKAFFQALDISDSTIYLPHRVGVRTGDYSDINDADIVVICAGLLPTIYEFNNIMDTLKLSIEAVKDIIENIKLSKFNGIIINISNPADVMTHYIQHKLDYNPKKVISTSTTLDSARLRRALSEAINIDQRSIHAYVIGQHGDGQVIPWSTITIAGKSLLNLIKDHPEKYGSINFEELSEKSKRAGWDILFGKGSAEFGIGASLAQIARAVLCDEYRVLPISVYLDGEYGQYDVYASVPAVLSSNGVEDIIELNLNREEKRLFGLACDDMRENYHLALEM